MSLRRFSPHVGAYLAWDVLSAGVLQYCMYLHGLYDRQLIRRARNRLLRLVRSAVVAGIVLAVVFFLVRPPELGRTALGIGFGLTVLVLWVLRTTAARALAARPERLLVLGGGRACAEILAATQSTRAPGFVVVGRVAAPEDGGCEGLPVLGDWHALSDLLEREPVDRLLLASSPPPGWDLGPLVDARLRGIGVAGARDFAEGLTGEVVEEDIDVDFITLGTSRAYGRISRLLDVVLALALLLALSPLLAVVALLVLATSGRPVLFRQTRIGRGGQSYTCWKFRTMAREAERDGPAWSPVKDPRVTRLGRFLRRWRIDELPQLVNVLRGDMAFVGPRPEQPFFVEKLTRLLPHYYLRHAVRPGLTGWAQVRHPYGSTEEDARAKLRFDLFYIKHRSPYLDLAVLFDTVRVVLRGEGR